MSRRILLPLAVGLVALLCAGCAGLIQSTDQYQNKQREIDRLTRNLKTVTEENVQIKGQLARLNANLEKLIAERDQVNARLTEKTRDEIGRLNADLARLTAEREDLRSRLAAKTAEMGQAVDRLTGLNAELEGDKQMLQESIDLVKKGKEELIVEIDDLKSKNAAQEITIDDLNSENDALANTIDDLKGKNAALMDDNRMLQENVDLLTRAAEEQAEAEAEAAAAAAEAAAAEPAGAAEEPAAKEEPAPAVSKAYEELLAEMKGEIERGQVAVAELKGRLTVDIGDKLLFDPGRVEVKPAGVQFLRRVAGILRDVTDRSLRVEGHTDNVRIGGTLAKRYPTNWEFSAARALAVTRALEQSGIDPALLSAAAFGEYRPVADNATPAGRAKNRRITIQVAPKE